MKISWTNIAYPACRVDKHIILPVIDKLLSTSFNKKYNTMKFLEI